MDATPPGLADLLDLFAHALADVRFGDLDAAALSSAAAQVSAAGSEVAAAEAKLADAHAILAARQEVLLVQANRALAYARVFAETDDALLARVNAIVLPRASRASRAPGVAPSREANVRTRRRGRPRRIAPDAVDAPAMLNALDDVNTKPAKGRSAGQEAEPLAHVGE